MSASETILGMSTISESHEEVETEAVPESPTNNDNDKLVSPQSPLEVLGMTGTVLARVKKLGFERIEDVQVFDSAELFKMGLQRWDIAHLSASLSRVGFPMKKADWGAMTKAEGRKPKYTGHPQKKEIDIEDDEEEEEVRFGFHSLPDELRFKLGVRGVTSLKQLTQMSHGDLRKIMGDYRATLVSQALRRNGMSLTRRYTTPKPHSAPKFGIHSLPDYITSKLKKAGVSTLIELTKLSFTEMQNIVGAAAAARVSRELKAHGLKFTPKLASGPRPLNWGKKSAAKTLKTAKKELAEMKRQLQTGSVWPSWLQLTGTLEAKGIRTLDQLLEYTYTDLLGKIGMYPAKVISKQLRDHNLKLVKKPMGPPKKSATETAHQPTPQPTSTSQESEDGGRQEGREEEYIGYIIGYAFRDIEERIYQFSATSGGKVSEKQLTRRLSELLHDKAQR